MTRSFILAASALLAIPAVQAQDQAQAQQQTITRAGTQDAVAGPTQNFTGRARVDPLFGRNAATDAGAAYVTFEPGARSNWHTHPRGQHLIVTAGVGRTQSWGGPVQAIRPGDVVWCPPGVKHWHGAAPNSAMTHISVANFDEGKNVEWLESVTNVQYNALKDD